MTTTMQLIAKQTIGANGATSVTFSNIPQTFTDLKIIGSARTTQGAYYGTTLLGLNGSSSNFSYLRIYAGSGSVGADTGATGLISIDTGNDNTADTFGNFEAYITDYTSSTTKKSYTTDSVDESNRSGDVYLELLAGKWDAAAAPITSMTLTAGATVNYAQYSTFYLYGISNSTTTQASTVPYASGGDVIATDGSYWYHTFLYSGTFTPLKNLTCDYLVVAGGGGGASVNGTGDAGNGVGGGGAGGYRTSIGGSALSLTANTAYVTTIGAGGAGAPQNTSVRGSNGSNSVFSTITSTGGGGGGGTSNAGIANGNDGGSGGGGGSYSGTGGAASPSGQGNTGGAGSSGGVYIGGGGGGAGAVGNGGNLSGTGGNGLANSISGTSVTYAGGGGGGAYGGQTGGNGGTGGGGKGGNGAGVNQIGVAGGNGTANLGAGGGGGGSGSSTSGQGAKGGTGGSGIIVVRYAV